MSEELIGLLRRWRQTGCPRCGGYCGSANPPVEACIMRETDEAIAAWNRRPEPAPVDGLVERLEAGEVVQVIDEHSRIVRNPPPVQLEAAAALKAQAARIAELEAVNERLQAIIVWNFWNSVKMRGASDERQGDTDKTMAALKEPRDD